ncbi:uncharacterized protein LOC121724424 [Alosa sapidissima]|uniref:uncharacterized protein LOC121724424 n=1 Tax=Alosa sapidissima TaxID=34773 RepID=UPI001C09C342|nr:uncharacterized protein LOC121724424 [Alosa sapidissima]
MNYSPWRADRYLMSFRFKTMLDSHHYCSALGKDISFGTGRHGVNVRVTNRVLTPLAPDHLQSVALSVPGLYARFQQYPTDRNLYHCGQLQIYRLPSATSEGDCRELSDSLLLKDGEPVGGSEEQQSGPGSLAEANLSADSDVHSQISDADEFYTCSSPDTVPSDTADSDGFHSASGDLPSLSPRLSGKGGDEQVFVEFRGQRYLRLLTPAKGREGDVESSWVVTDFTEDGEELVFSLCLDFIRPQPVVPRWMKDLEEESK